MARAQTRDQSTSAAARISALEERVVELEAQNEQLKVVRIAELQDENAQLKRALRLQIEGELGRANAIQLVAIRKVAEVEKQVELLQGRLRTQETKARVAGWVEKAQLMEYEAIDEMGDTTLEMGQEKEGDDEVPLGLSLSCTKPSAGGIVLEEFLRRKNAEAERDRGSTWLEEQSLSLDTISTVPSLDKCHDTDISSSSSFTFSAALPNRAVLQPLPIADSLNANDSPRPRDTANKVGRMTDPIQAADKPALVSCMRQVATTPSRSPQRSKPAKGLRLVRAVAVDDISAHV